MLKKYLQSYFISVLLLIASTYRMNAQSVPEHIKELVDREKQFGQLAEQKGIKNAFLSVLYQNGIVFRPEPMNGITYFKSIKEDISGLLTWEPVFADVSNDQTLGYTTGPFEFKKDNNGQVSINYGQYVSIWIKPKKKWELMVDLGISHEQTAFIPQFTYANPLTFGMTRASLDFIAEEQQKHSMEILKATDELYCTAIKEGKTESTYKEFMGQNIRLLRNNHLPILGKEAAMQFLETEKAEHHYQNTKVYAAPSRDLGYTIGAGTIISIIDQKKVEKKVYYLRIWRKENAGFWRIVLDIEAPIPVNQN